MKRSPVVVYVANKTESEAFAEHTNMVTYGADTMRAALGETIFTYPDAIVIDASEDMLRAENTYFHLRTIDHPPIVLLSNTPWRWETDYRGTVVILPEGSDHDTIAETIKDFLAEEVQIPS